MTSLLQLLNEGVKDKFIGIVEFEETKVVGILEDPVGIDPANLRLGYPLEFKTKHESKQGVEVYLHGFLFPEEGIPEERILDGGGVTVYSGSGHIAGLYLQALKEIVRRDAEVRHSGAMINRQ